MNNIPLQKQIKILYVNDNASTKQETLGLTAKNTGFISYTHVCSWLYRYLLHTLLKDLCNLCLNIHCRLGAKNVRNVWFQNSVQHDTTGCDHKKVWKWHLFSIRTTLRMPDNSWARNKHRLDWRWRAIVRFTHARNTRIINLQSKHSNKIFVKTLCCVHCVV